jgi:hypothetical protein
MKKFFMLATAALLVSGATFACDKDGGKKGCCKKGSKACCKKDKKKDADKTATM